MKNIFVSYNFNDKAVVHTIQNMANQYSERRLGNFNFTSAVAVQGDAAIEGEIRRIMNQCDTVLFVIGDNNHNSPWINREVDLAISYNKHLVLTRLPNTTGGAPQKLARYPVTNWNLRDLASAF